MSTPYNDNVTSVAVSAERILAGDAAGDIHMCSNDQLCYRENKDGSIDSCQPELVSFFEIFNLFYTFEA